MFLHAAIVAVITRKLLARQCAACGKKQLFPPSKLGKAVYCWRYEALIEPIEKHKS